MANVKFFKGICTDTTKYEAGGIYFDLKTREIRLGKDGTTAYDAYGNGIKDVVLAGNILTISFHDATKKSIVLDFSDIASATDTGLKFKELADKIAALEAKAPIAGNDISITEGTNAINVALKDDITVAGGPLADNIVESGDAWPWADAAGNKIIPKDKSLSEILAGLFLKELNGTLTESYTWAPSVGAPSAAFDKTGAIEVGTNIVPTFAANSTVSGNNSKVTIEGTYGVVVDNKFQSGAYTETKAGTVAGTAVASATIELGSDAAVAATSGTAYSAKEGMNTLSVSNSGLTANATAFTAKTVYASTNTKKKVEGVSKVVDVDRFTTKPLSSTASASLTAYYPIYAYGKESSTSDTSAPTVAAPAEPVKLPLVADGSRFGVAFPAMVDGGAGYRILLEAHKSIKSATALNGLTSKYDINCLDKFKKGETVTKATGATTTAYNVWEYKGTEGANRVIFTIGK